MKDETRSFYETAIQRALERIVCELDSALELGALARSAALSPLHFHRVFRGMVGETPLELQRRLRLERAAWQLGSRDVSVTTIAFEAGYETHEAFTRAFRRAYGVPPSAFRQAQSTASDAGCKRPYQMELAARCGVHFSPEGQRNLLVRFITGDQNMQVELKQMPELRVAAVHHTGPYNRISEAFERLGSIAGPAGLMQQPGAAMLGLYHDDPETTPVDQLRSDAAVVVPKDVQLPAGLTELHIPAGLYACTTHVGPYTGLGDAWSRFMGEWLPKSGHRVGQGVSFEIYRNTPMTAPKEELCTEMYLPIAN